MPLLNITNILPTETKSYFVRLKLYNIKVLAKMRNISTSSRNIFNGCLTVQHTTMLIRGVSVVKQHNLVIKMLYSISETTCFGQKWPSSGFYTY